jgi:hypothetical protein
LHKLGPHRNNLTLGKLHNPIGQLQAGGTMRNQDDSAPRENVAAVLDEGELTLWIEHGGGFVENEYWRVLQQSTR